MIYLCVGVSTGDIFVCWGYTGDCVYLTVKYLCVGVSTCVTVYLCVGGIYR